MIPTRTLFTAACLAGLSGLLPAEAHHQASEARQYLVFWAGSQAPHQAAIQDESCRVGTFWEKGFVSIYAQVGSFSGTR